MGKYIAAGTTLAYFGFVDSSGVLLGESTSAPAVNVLSPMRRLLGIQSASPGIPEGEDVSIDGDDGTLGTISFAANTTPAFVANFGAFDLATAAAMQQTAVWNMAGFEHGALQPEDPGAPNGCMIIQGKSVNKDDGTSGLAVWSGIILPLVTAQPLGRESFEGRTAASNRIKFTAQISAKHPSGITITSSNLGTTGASGIEFEGDHPMIMDRYTGNGAATSTTLTKEVAATDHIAAIVNTQVLTHGSGITAVVGSKTLTFSSAPASGAKVVIVYGFIP
jgi:hypothetical protein